MNREAVVPGAMTASPDLPFSPGVRSGETVFVTGMTGRRADGTMPDTAGGQADAAFDKIAAVLAETGGNLDSVVEITSYHIDIRDHFGAIANVVRARLGQPGPAWTAVGVAELRRPGALVEIRAVAQVPRPDPT